MSNCKLSLKIPTLKEDATIATGIACDPDTYEPSEKEIMEMKPIRKGRPSTATNKVLLSVRYSPEVVEYFRATGSGWQSRMDEVLKNWVTTHAS